MTYNDAVKKELTVNLKDDKGLFEKQDGKFLGEVLYFASFLKLKVNYSLRFYYRIKGSIQIEIHRFKTTIYQMV
jgi:hypothetical protein